MLPSMPGVEQAKQQQKLENKAVSWFLASRWLKHSQGQVLERLGHGEGSGSIQELSVV